jgi:hypothetical protein
LLLADLYPQENNLLNNINQLLIHGGGSSLPWRNHERKTLENSHTMGSGGILFPFGAFLIFFKKLKGG